jgi:hypothetical protein
MSIRKNCIDCQGLITLTDKERQCADCIIGEKMFIDYGGDNDKNIFQIISAIDGIEIDTLPNKKMKLGEANYFMVTIMPAVVELVRNEVIKSYLLSDDFADGKRFYHV